MMRNYEDCLIESHEEKSWKRAMIEKYEDYLIESHNRKS